MSLRWASGVLVSALTVFSAHAQTAPAADPAKGQTIAQVCSACHGADGNSAQPANPILAGQHADYTAKQLANFKPQDGKPAERQNPIMAGMVATLSADDMRNVAAYFESQKPQPRAARDPKLVKLGRPSIAAVSRREAWRPARPATARPEPGYRRSFRGSRDSTPNTRPPS